jgi:hypothetical protein
LTISRFQTFRREDGQVLIIAVVFFTALLAVAALVIDGGNTLLQRRNQQGVADAAALAAVKDLPLSAVAADASARSYATARNSADASSVDQVVVTTSTTGTCDGGLGSIALGRESVCVVLHTHTDGSFSQIVGINNWNVHARAVAQVSQVNAIGGWLPIGVRTAAVGFSPPTQITITPGDGSANVGGAINTPAGPGCKFYGGNQIGDVIKGAARGGADACPIAIGQTVPTQTGVQNGNITTKGFDVRIGSNTESFSDVFGLDASGNYYVKNPNSPRLGIMPIAQDSTSDWPLAGGAAITVKGYALVYIGNRQDPPTFPAYSGNGNKLTIYLTPVNAPLPDSFTALIGDYDPANLSPLVYRLVQ